MFMLLISLAVAGNASSATTYYIASNGSDSNNGASNTTPWAHLPGMLTWTGTHIPVAGDTFILRGCDVWGNGNFPIIWKWSGSSGNPITIDRDTTWYNTTNCPAGWNRAIFDAGGTAIQAPECTGSNRNFYIITNSAIYVTIGWIEARDYYWNSAQGSTCWGGGGFFEANSSDYITLDSWYFHKWTTGPSATDNDHMIGTTNTSPYCVHCVLKNSVLDNSDGNGNSGVGVVFNALNNVIYDVSNDIKPIYQGEFGGNNIYRIKKSFDGTSHPNCIETVGALGPSPSYYIHDNLVHDNVICEGLQVGNSREIDYVWNNIWYNNTSVGANGPNLPQAGSTTVALYYWNNTNVDSRNVCVAVASNGNKWSTAFVMQNNHCITAGTPSGTMQSQGMVDGTISGAATITISNNVVESLTNANSKGYSNVEGYVYSPTSGMSETVGVGTNLTITNPGCGTVGLSGLCSDATYACSEQTISGVVQAVCPTRTSNSRPSSGAWDVGAYQFGQGTSTTKPNPPTGLAAVVQ